MTPRDSRTPWGCMQLEALRRRQLDQIEGQAWRSALISILIICAAFAAL